MGLRVLLDVVHSHVSSNTDDGLAGTHARRSLLSSAYTHCAPQELIPLDLVLSGCGVSMMIFQQPIIEIAIATLILAAEQQDSMLCAFQGGA